MHTFTALHFISGGGIPSAKHDISARGAPSFKVLSVGMIIVGGTDTSDP